MDKIVVITGASAGIGAALAEELAGRGAKVVLAARSADRLAALADRLGADRALAVATDVRVDDDVVRLRDAALARWGRIDVWVNNAGVGITRAPSEVTDEDLDTMMDINVKAALRGTRAVLPHFRARGAGQLVNVSSMLGRAAFVPMRSAYAAAKAALNSLTDALRKELAASAPGIHVTLVLPGVVATDFGKNAVGGGPDSRTLPNAQPVEEVARIVADAIENPRDEVTTR